jgi:hypothetical protein
MKRTIQIKDPSGKVYTKTVEVTPNPFKTLPSEKPIIDSVKCFLEKEIKSGRKLIHFTEIEYEFENEKRVCNPIFQNKIPSDQLIWKYMNHTYKYDFGFLYDETMDKKRKVFVLDNIK